jgi:hypothetical protein
MLFSDVLGSMTRAGDAWTASVPSDWLQGRSVFGGLQAALALRAMRDLAPELPLRVLQTTFLAPVPEGRFSIDARVLRAGKTTFHAEARIRAGADTAAIVVAIFGKARPSRIALAPRPWPIAATEPTLGLHDARAGLPAFIQHFDLRWRRGGPPGAGSPLAEAIIDVDLRDAGPATEAHVVAIADATPPVALSMLDVPAPASSLTWMLEMLHDGPLAALSLSGWRLDVALVAGGGGYTSQSEVVWGPGGEAIALSTQSMVVFG